jgi:hypothetical protein
MKWGLGVVLIAGLALALFLYLQPSLALSSLASAIEDGDVEGIKDHVDFDSVRRNLRDEFVAKMDLGSDEDGDNGATALAAALVSKGVEAMLDGMLSPERLAQGGGGEVEITSSEYKTASRFHATVQRVDSHAPLTLVLRRSGMDWRVTAIKPPEVTWREFEGYRRQLTGEVGDNLKSIFMKLAERHDGLAPGDPKAISIPRTPQELPCGEPYAWTEEDRKTWEVIGFAPSGPTNYSYSVLTAAEAGAEGVELMLAHAAGDLDCDGQTSFFSLAMGENPDGDLYRAPGIYADEMLE